jgi:hypothetical protein
LNALVCFCCNQHYFHDLIRKVAHLLAEPLLGCGVGLFNSRTRIRGFCNIIHNLGHISQVPAFA